MVFVSSYVAHGMEAKGFTALVLCQASFGPVRIFANKLSRLHTEDDNRKLPFPVRSWFTEIRVVLTFMP